MELSPYKTQRYGWRPPLKSDKDIKLSFSQPVPLPLAVDLRIMCPAVYDQLQIGSCTGNAIAAAYEYDLIFQGLPLWRPSRLFIYYNERVIEGTTSVDAGASIKDGLASLNKVGVCTENTWIYDEDLVTVKPSVMAYDEAATRKIFNYKNIPDGDFYLMKQTLANKKPFVFGFTVYDSFESDEVARTGIMPASYNSGKVLGGHAVMCVGYDDAKGWVIVRNSWGSGWGDNGYFYMPYSYIQNSNLCSDIWVINHI